jgi:hypothetical protein
MDPEAPVMLSVAVVASEYTPVLLILLYPLPEFSCHWYVSDVPEAATVKLVLEPEHAEAEDGCKVTEGTEFTLSVAAFEVAAGVQVPETTQR